MHENLSPLYIPFLFLLVSMPFGFLTAAFVHGAVSIPRWIVEHAGA